MLSDIDLVEINEAFAAQYLAVEKLLELDRDKVNVNGGAIALGHPLGATGTRLVMTVLYELRRRNKRYGLAAACIGGGQGSAVILGGIRWASKRWGVLGGGWWGPGFRRGRPGRGSLRAWRKSPAAS